MVYLQLNRQVACPQYPFQPDYSVMCPKCKPTVEAMDEMYEELVRALWDEVTMFEGFNIVTFTMGVQLVKQRGDQVVYKQTVQWHLSIRHGVTNEKCSLIVMYNYTLYRHTQCEVSAKGHIETDCPMVLGHVMDHIQEKWADKIMVSAEPDSGITGVCYITRDKKISGSKWQQYFELWFEGAVSPPAEGFV